MTVVEPAGATIPGVTHHRTRLNGVDLHYITAGSGGVTGSSESGGVTGSTILLVHGWPETWWAFRALIPLLAESHHVVAVDLRGFGDSGTSNGTGTGTGTGNTADFTEQAFADDLHELVAHLGGRPVHLVTQDISGGLAFRFAATHPDEVLSFTAIESSLAGFGLEALADVNAHGSWHVGFLGTPGIPSLLLPGRERELLAEWAYPMMNATDGAILPADLDEFLRTYSRLGAWRGTEGLYRSLFTDAGATKALAEASPLAVPVLTIDGANAPFTELSFRPVAAGDFTAIRIDGVGHLVAQEAPAALAEALLGFAGGIDRGDRISGSRGSDPRQ
ncbi:alpha/beta hydrolase [Herbiconiux sp.]|uniref:alpha/beta fold hydrolase n=1 Tax=Herbiconiux sp. TaxID=1871186 RepID=UPI0025C3D28D|nr:alpha/beta hydrolase [Herbiconiux sp.]